MQSLDDEDDAVYYNQAIPLELILQTPAGVKHLRVIILDAYRDNPFIHKMRSRGQTPPQPGLAKMDENTLIGSDTLIAYATPPGLIADDGDGDHSPFTQALLKHLAEPGLDIRRMFGKVGDDVRQTTRQAQSPFYYSELGGGEIVLVPAAAVPQTQDERLEAEAIRKLVEVKRKAEEAQRAVQQAAEAKRKAEETKCSSRANPQAQIECLQDLIEAMRGEIAALKADREERLIGLIDRRIEEALEPRLHH